MNVNLSIKGVPEHVAARLRERAERNRRSLQKELRAIIERAAEEGATQAAAGTGFASPAAPPATAEVVFRPGSLTIEEIAAQLRSQYPEPVAELPRSVDIIRQMRDSR